MRLGDKLFTTLVIRIQFECDFLQNITAVRSSAIIGLPPAGGNRFHRSRFIRFGQASRTNMLIEFHRSGHTNESNVVVFFELVIVRMWYRFFDVNILDHGIIGSFAIEFAKTNNSRWTTAKWNQYRIYREL